MWVSDLWAWPTKWGSKQLKQFDLTHGNKYYIKLTFDIWSEELAAGRFIQCWCTPKKARGHITSPNSKPIERLNHGSSILQYCTKVYLSPLSIKICHFEYFGRRWTDRVVEKTWWEAIWWNNLPIWIIEILQLRSKYIQWEYWISLTTVNVWNIPIRREKRKYLFLMPSYSQIWGGDVTEHFLQVDDFFRSIERA